MPVVPLMGVVFVLPVLFVVAVGLSCGLLHVVPVVGVVAVGGVVPVVFVVDVL